MSIRNVACPCGSGLKFKHCCLPKGATLDLVPYRDIKDKISHRMLHTQLTPDCEQRLRKIWDRVKHIDHCNSYEHIERDFCGNVFPEQEIAVFERIVKALNTFMARHPDAEEKRIYNLLIARSAAGIPKKPDSDWAEVCKIYGKGRPMTVWQNGPPKLSE